MGGDRPAGGGQRMAYRVRSNALADLQMPSFKTRTTSESGAKELASEAERSFSAAQKPNLIPLASAGSSVEVLPTSAACKKDKGLLAVRFAARID